VVVLTASVAGALLVPDQRSLRRVLAVVVLLFAAYIPAAILAHPPGGRLVVHSIVPSLVPTSTTMTAVLALVGTTLTAYVYFWQTIEESEEQGRRLRRPAQRDAMLGMAAASAVFWFILVAEGTTVGEHGGAIHTPGEAARAPRPVAGTLSSSLFDVGLLLALVQQSRTRGTDGSPRASTWISMEVGQ
jgi:Mn2+/Fe2+ NRAMP family transporter